MSPYACDTVASEKLDAKDKRTVTFAPSNLPPDLVVSCVTQSDASITPLMQRGSVTFIAANTHKKIILDTSKETNILHLPPTAPYDFNVQFNYGPPNVKCFFHKATYRVKFWRSVMSNALLAVSSLLDKGAGPDLFNYDSVPQA